jgi:hypothetical protein
MDLSVQVSVTSHSRYLSGQILTVIFFIVLVLLRIKCALLGLIYFVMDVLYSFAFEYAHLFIPFLLGVDFVCVNYSVPATISSYYFLELQDNISWNKFNLSSCDQAMRLKCHLWSLPIISSLLWKLCRYFVFIILHLFIQTSSHVLWIRIFVPMCVV